MQAKIRKNSFAFLFDDTITCVAMRSAAGRASSSAPSMDIDLKRQSFPLCVVWCPIPVITHLFPPIGHLGVCFSDGEILDFLGPKFVHRGSLGFGSVARYWRLDPKRWLANGDDVSNESSDAAFDRGVAAHDAAVARASSFFAKHEHYDLFGNNCHQFVAHCLNVGAYGGKQDWNMTHLAVLVLLRGKWVNAWACVKTWGVFCALATACVAKSFFWPALVAYFSAFALLSAWFFYYSFFLAQPLRKVFATPVAAREGRETRAHGDGRA